MIIAEKCCGSCENWDIDNLDSSQIGYCFCKIIKVTTKANFRCSDDYSPRYKVKSKHEKMWNELKDISNKKSKEGSLFFRVLESTIFKVMKEIEVKYGGDKDDLCNNNKIN